MSLRSIALSSVLSLAAAACQSSVNVSYGTDYTFAFTEQPGAFLITFENRSGKDLCMPFSAWPGARGHRGLASSSPEIARDGRVNRYAPNVGVDLSAPEQKRFRKRSKTTAILAHADFSFPVRDGDVDYLRFLPSVSVCPRFVVPPLND